MFRRRSRHDEPVAGGREVSRREIAGLARGEWYGDALSGDGFSRDGLLDDGVTAGTHVRPSIPLVQQLLDEFGLRHGIDSDGDLVVRWEKCSIYFFFYGDENEVLQARLYLNRRFSVDDRSSLVLMLDEWNRTRLMGKAYTILPDDGRVCVCAEHAHDFEAATRAQIKYAVAMWIDVLLRFGDWIDEQI